MDAGFVERLAAWIGLTFNPYADSPLRRARLVAYLAEHVQPAADMGPSSTQLRRSSSSWAAAAD